MKDKETIKEITDERLVKIISEAGIASRRKCEKIIESGRVRVNNIVVVDPAYKVNDEDTVSVDRQIIERETKRYIALYKPLGVVSTTKKLPGRRVITEFFKDIKERLFYAGRLDSESRGIMIITNDGEFANIITHPSYEILKVYDVTVSSKIETERILKASSGIRIKNIKYSPFKFKILSNGRLQSKIRLTINEGKNREIRKIFEYLGYNVVDLERISVGCVSKFHPGLGTLEVGQTRALSEEEINFFFDKKKSMYKNISAENIDDFDFSLVEDELSEDSIIKDKVEEAQEMKEDRDVNKEENKEEKKYIRNKEHTRNKKVKKQRKDLWAKAKVKPGREKSNKLKSSTKISKQSFNNLSTQASKKTFGSKFKKPFNSTDEKSSKYISKNTNTKSRKDKDTQNSKTRDFKKTYSKRPSSGYSKKSSSGSYLEKSSVGEYTNKQYQYPKRSSSGYSKKPFDSNNADEKSSKYTSSKKPYTNRKSSSGNYSKKPSSSGYSKKSFSSDSKNLNSNFKDKDTRSSKSENFNKPYTKRPSGGNYSKKTSSSGYSKKPFDSNNADEKSSKYTSSKKPYTNRKSSSGNYSKKTSSSGYSKKSFSSDSKNLNSNFKDKDTRSSKSENFNKPYTKRPSGGNYSKKPFNKNNGKQDGRD